MTNRTLTGVFFLMLTTGLTGCDDARRPTSPTAPSVVAQPAVPTTAAQAKLIGVTLFGVVSETTPTGRVPIADVSIYCDACGVDGHTMLQTDGNGFYSFNGDLGSGGGIWLMGDTTLLLLGKPGYYDPVGQPGGAGIDSQRLVTIKGDTRFDIELVRR